MEWERARKESKSKVRLTRLTWTFLTIFLTTRVVVAGRSSVVVLIMGTRLKWTFFFSLGDAGGISSSSKTSFVATINKFFFGRKFEMVFFVKRSKGRILFVQCLKMIINVNEKIVWGLLCDLREICGGGGGGIDSGKLPGPRWVLPPRRPLPSSAKWKIRGN